MVNKNKNKKIKKTYRNCNHFSGAFASILCAWQRYSWLGKPSRLIPLLYSLFAEVSAKRMVDKKRKGRKMKKKNKNKEKKE